MRAIRLLSSVAIIGLTALSSSASAQVGFGIYVGPSDGYVEYSPGYTREYRTAPRVYGYSRRYRDDADASVELRDRPSRRGGCGTYHYWDGDRCVDARYR